MRSASSRSTGSRVKGYEDFIVQDLVLRPHVGRIRRERWLTPDGQTILAPMPAGRRCRLGPLWAGPAPLRAAAIPSGPGHHAAPGGPTPGDRHRDLQAPGRLNADTGPFVEDAVLRAGLETAPWISVDGPSGNALRAVHRRPPPAPERLLHTNWQRSLR